MVTAMWDTLLGSQCVLCLESLTGRHARLQLCRYCLEALPWREGDPGQSVSDLIACQVIPLHYEEPVSGWVVRAKHVTGLVEAKLLGTLLAEAVMAIPGTKPDLLVPVPLSRRRLLRRGHNQAALIAEPVARGLGVPVNRTGVRRVVHTRILAGSDRAERRQRVAGVFRCRLDLTGMTVAIVDDVVTSGATARELAGCLATAGALRIHLFAAAAAPPPAVAMPRTNPLDAATL
jgi:ComF family protein